MKPLESMTHTELVEYIAHLEHSLLCCKERANRFKTKAWSGGPIHNGAQACAWIASEIDGLLRAHDRLPT